MSKVRESATQFGNSDYTESDPPAPGVVYVFIQFGDQYVKAFRNSILARSSLLHVYHGRCLGLARQVDVVEGCWRDQRAVSVFEFDSHFNAGMWLESDPEVRQGDFMNGCDIITTSTMGLIPPGRPLFQLMDLRIYNSKAFMEQYVPGHLLDMQASGGLNAVATQHYNCHRGSFTPDFCVVHQWQSYEAFYKWYRSDDYNCKWKPYRLNSADTNMILFKLEPL